MLFRSLTKRVGIEEGTVLDSPLIEYCLKNDELGDPIISREHIINFNWLKTVELDLINEQCFRINDFLQGMFKGVGIKLVDFKVEFGKAKSDGRIILADENWSKIVFKKKKLKLCPRILKKKFCQKHFLSKNFQSKKIQSKIFFG